jgi:hypothetical protein
VSNYTKITRHPNTGKYYLAEYKDDYFGPHLYGVRFPEDEVVYPYEQVANAQLKEFWVKDVFDALRDYGLQPEEILEFTDHLQTAYKERWKRDPLGGEGAVDNFREKL